MNWLSFFLFVFLVIPMILSIFANVGIDAGLTGEGIENEQLIAHTHYSVAIYDNHIVIEQNSNFFAFLYQVGKEIPYLGKILEVTSLGSPTFGGIFAILLAIISSYLGLKHWRWLEFFFVRKRKYVIAEFFTTMVLLACIYPGIAFFASSIYSIYTYTDHDKQAGSETFKVLEYAISSQHDVTEQKDRGKFAAIANDILTSLSLKKKKIIVTTGDQLSGQEHYSIDLCGLVCSDNYEAASSAEKQQLERQQLMANAQLMRNITYDIYALFTNKMVKFEPEYSQFIVNEYIATN